MNLMNFLYRFELCKLSIKFILMLKIFIQCIHTFPESMAQIVVQCNVMSILYSAQYIHVLQDSKHYLTYPTAQVQTKSLITDIPITERQRLKDDHLSPSLRFFSLPPGRGTNGRGLPF